MPQPIAVIGISLRVAGADDVERFWHNVKNGIESISFFADRELLDAGVSSATLADPDFVRAGGQIKGIDRFAAEFFGVSPLEAAATDPQHRLFLECCWNAMAAAGYGHRDVQAPVGVYASVSLSRYLLQLLGDRHLVGNLGLFQAETLNEPDHLPTWVSYKLNLRGPSVAIQTACSSSLTAVHTACQALLAGECDMALAGGVQLLVPPSRGYFYRRNGVLSPDGHCRAFDARAEGFVPGDGVGVVVLKPLDTAMADGDYIHAVIKASAANNDGSSKMGYFAPSVAGQSAVIAEALATAGVAPDEIGYVEAHGTGTKIGDAVEVTALNAAYAAVTRRRQFCALGSVKTNIGHAGHAAGVIGLIKATLAVEHGFLPPIVNFETSNPEIDFASGAVYVNTRLQRWSPEAGPRRAGVSSFGLGGTNVHVILEQAPFRDKRPSSRRSSLLCWSGFTPVALETATSNLEGRVSTGAVDVDDVAYTLHVGRSAFPHRRMLVVSNQDEVAARLRAASSLQALSPQPARSELNIAFMFPGGGAQHLRMGADLYVTEPTYRDRVDQCCSMLPLTLASATRDVLGGNAHVTSEQLNRPALALPSLFIVEYALAMLLMEWGIVPMAMIGHSLGEYAAACVSGALDLRDALDLVVCRGQLTERIAEGAMLSVPLAEDDLRSDLGPGLSIAAINAPRLCVVSGAKTAVVQLKGALAQRGIDTHLVNIAVAAHSELVDPILDEFREALAPITLHRPRIPYMSNVAAAWRLPEDPPIDAHYWVDHLRRTVRFSDGLRGLLERPVDVLLEVGPGSALAGLARQHPARRTDVAVLTSMRHPTQDARDDAVLMQALGDLWVRGARVDWPSYWSRDRRCRVPLPPDVLETQPFWVRTNGSPMAPLQKRLEKRPVNEWFYVPYWKPLTIRTTEGQHPESSSDSWLLLVDRSPLCRAIVRRLEASGIDVVTVEEGTEYERVSRTAYRLRPAGQEDYLKLAEDLNVVGIRVAKVIHCWLAARIEEKAPQSDLDDGLYSAVFLVQALGASAQKLELHVIASGVCQVAARDAIIPEKAAIVGPLAVVPQEYPEIRTQLIDIDPAAPRPVGETAAEAIEYLVRPVPTGHGGLRLVALREGRAWTRAFEPVELPRESRRPPALVQRGTYLVTGGLGGIGLLVAEYLARQARARVILTSRSPFPPRAQWAQWLSEHDASERTASIIKRVIACEDLGAEVWIEQSDVADAEEVRELRRRIHGRCGTVDGIFQAAGVAAGGLVALKTRVNMEPVLAPKVSGTRFLEDVFLPDEPDFIVLFSSLAALEGGVGQVDHCGANAVLDAFAARGALRTRIIAINWDTWGEAGQAVETVVPAALSGLKEANLKDKILSAEGIDALDRILRSPFPHVCVSTRELSAALERAARSRIDSPLQPSSDRNGVPLASARPELATPYAPPRNALEAELARACAEFMSLDRVGIHDSFFVLGGHSLLAIQFLAHIRDTMNIDISLKTFLAGPTVAQWVAANNAQLEMMGDAAQLEAELARISGMTPAQVRDELGREEPAR